MVSGTINWPNSSNPIWQFSYSLTSDPEGISIFGARYRNRQVFYKASLPSLRVQYDQSCGPYKDPLTESNAHIIPPSFSKVKVSTINTGNRRIILEAYHTIGNYKLLEKWTFTENGYVYPQLYSSGLQCNYNHRHHVYWRFDFDIEGSTKDLAFEYNSNTPDIGYGPGWHKKSFEIMRN
jgi:hypothetical protein